MFAVNVALGNTCWRLLFKTEEKAKLAFENLKPLAINTATITVEDDFGQMCSAVASSIHGLMFEDLDKAKMANVALYIHQQHVQLMATKAAQADPALRASSIMNGPAIHQPAGLRNQ